MSLVLPLKDHEVYCQKPLKDLPEEHFNFCHYLILLSIFQTLEVMNVGGWFFFKIFLDILVIYLWYDCLFAHIKHTQMVLIKVAEC